MGDLLLRLPGAPGPDLRSVIRIGELRDFDAAGLPATMLEAGVRGRVPAGMFVRVRPAQFAAFLDRPAVMRLDDAGLHALREDAEEAVSTTDAATRDRLERWEPLREWLGAAGDDQRVAYVGALRGDTCVLGAIFMLGSGESSRCDAILGIDDVPAFASISSDDPQADELTLAAVARQIGREVAGG